MYRQLGILLALLSLGTSLSMAQPKPMKWGKVPTEDLQMTEYQADTNAVAVVLGEYGEVVVRRNGDMVLDYHIRIKLLSEAAYEDWGTVSLFRNKQMFNIKNIEGQTFVLGDNGKPQKHKMGKKSVFKEKLDSDRERLKFTLPALAPGAVIEYRYRKTFDSPAYLPDWTFQHSEPTRWSEYRTTISNRFQFVRVSTVPSFTIEESREENMPGDESVTSRWAMKDVKALRDEAFVTTINDYRFKLEFQLSGYYTQSMGFIKHLKTWDELAKELREINSFGKGYKPSKSVKRKAEELVAGLTDNKDKIKAIHNYVRDNHNWDGEYWGYIPDKDPGDVLKQSQASVPEQAMLMVALLRAAGITANPVLISTRSNGAVKKIYPLYSQFNYLIAEATVGGKTYLLDASDKNASHTLLPEHALNGVGWRVGPTGNDWVNVGTRQKYMGMITLDGTLAGDGSAEFDLKTASNGYRALELRDAYDEVDGDDFVVGDVLEEEGEYRLENIQVVNADSLEKPFEVSSKLYLPDAGAVAGDFMYLKVHPVSNWEENPFRADERTFPVDFSFPRDYIFNMKVKLPAGYIVHEKPKDTLVRLPLKGGAFRRSITVQDDVLMIQSRLSLSKTVYPASQYRDLRDMFDKVVAAQAEQIVLKKGEAVAEGGD